MSQETITVPLEGWGALAALFPDVPFFEVGQRLELSGYPGGARLATVVSWSLEERRLVVEMDAPAPLDSLGPIC